MFAGVSVVERSGNPVAGTGRSDAIQDLRQYRTQAGSPVFCERLFLFRFESGPGVRFRRLERRFGLVQAVGRLSVAVKGYRTVFAELYGSTQAWGGWADTAVLDGLSIPGGLTMPPTGNAGAIPPELILRRAGESPEEYIPRITALIRQAAIAMLDELERYKRRVQEQTKKRKMKIH